MIRKFDLICNGSPKGDTWAERLGSLGIRWCCHVGTCSYDTVGEIEAKFHCFSTKDPPEGLVPLGPLGVIHIDDALPLFDSFVQEGVKIRVW